MSDPKVEEIRDPREYAQRYIDTLSLLSPGAENDLIWTLRSLLTKLDEAESDAQRAEDQANNLAGDLAVAEGRERTLIAGVREALDKLERHAGAASWPTRNGKAFAAIWMAEAFAILSRLPPSTDTRFGSIKVQRAVDEDGHLLPSTPTEEGKNDE